MEQTNFKFYQADNVYGALFFQFPKVLMYGEQYRYLSSEAKLAYMVLKDRLEYSLRNHWVDEEGHVYFIFTNQELMDLFNCSKGKLATVKKELEKAGLLYQKAMHFNPKTGKNEPNRLYLAELDMRSTDVYLRGEYGQKEPQTLATSESLKNRHDLDKEPKEKDKDRYNIDTHQLDFSTANYTPAEINQQNHDLVSHAYDFLTDADTGQLFLEPSAVQLLSFWCRTPQQMRRFIGIILNAKYAIEKAHKDLGVWITLDDPELKSLMTKTLRRYFNALRSNEKHIKNVENYLYGTMQNLFSIYWNKKANAKYQAEHPETGQHQAALFN